MTKSCGRPSSSTDLSIMSGLLPGAESISAASEACFTLAAHLDLVGRRVHRLTRIKPGTDEDREALRFVQHELVEVWNVVRESAVAEEQQAGLGADAGSMIDRCLSPSDFGFHNALISEGDEVKFLDFEYAGWDDPARTVCDFFCQPAVPVPGDYFAEFSTVAAALCREPSRCMESIELLMPVYRIKWCCIILNEFLNVDGARRSFAIGGASPRERKAQQLAKASRYIAAVR